MQSLQAAGFKDVVGERLSTILHYDTPEDACGAAFAGGLIALAYTQCAAHTRQATHAKYLRVDNTAEDCHGDAVLLFRASLAV